MDTRSPTHCPPDRDPDREVLELVASGDLRTAACRLMRCYGAAIYRYCHASLGDAALADDVHQQVFIEAFRDLASFGGRTAMRFWLFGIAHHRVVDALRARRRAQSYFEVIQDEDALDAPDLRPTADESIDDARLYAALAAGVGDLSEPVRTALLLHYHQGFTFERMADVCREKPGTLQARVARALPQLRSSIEARFRRPLRRPAAQRAATPAQARRAARRPAGPRLAA